mgnify:FL=1|tara:strand:+ start:2836 stop:3234 length:399 start_codon:yes stop_codon:yes gene_type:complete
MADIVIQFPRGSYPSLQIGDMGYYADSTVLSSNSGFTTTGNTSESDLTQLGTVKSIDHTTSLENGTLTTTITFNGESGVDTPNASDFVFFSKDNKVNSSSLLGYYAEVKFKNNSSDKAEMAAAACEISESSK